MEIPRAYFSNATVHRSLSPSPEDGILSCGFLVKPTARDTDRDLVFSYYGGFLLLSGGGEYQDAAHPSIPLRPGCFVQRLPGVPHSTIVRPTGDWLEFFVCIGREVFESMANLGLLSREPVLFPGLTEHLCGQCSCTVK